MESIWNADVVWRYERDLAFSISLMVWTCIRTAVCPSSKERKSGIKPLNFQTKDLGWFSGLINISICECSVKTAKAQGVQCVLPEPFGNQSRSSCTWVWTDMLFKKIVPLEQNWEPSVGDWVWVCWFSEALSVWAGACWHGNSPLAEQASATSWLTRGS